MNICNKVKRWAMSNVTVVLTKDVQFPLSFSGQDAVDNVGMVRRACHFPYLSFSM